MIDFLEVCRIHDILIEKFGGAKGIRDKNALDSALQRPFSTFDKKELYPTPVEKAAALIESIITNHPFIDGNKRTGYVLMRLMLIRNGLDILTSENIKYDFVISISKGELKFEVIKNWIEKNIKP
jgi:death-on-curing protein